MEYKLYYFEARAVGEPIRFVLAYAGLQFEDIRVKYETWGELKKSMPFGKMPVLDVNGEKLHQSVAICRYFGKKAGIAGKNDMEALEIDMAVDTFQDFRQEVAKHFFEKDKDKKEKLFQTLITDTIPYYMSKFDEQIQNNGGYLANGELSWGDLYLAAFCDTLNGLMGTNIFEGKYPNFMEMKEKVFSIPNIKAWIAKRPQTTL